MQKIVIVGASSGIGLEMARQYAHGGAQLGLCARRTEPLAALAAEFPGQVDFCSLDVNSPEAPGALHALIDRMGGMELYIHLAGIGYDNPAMDPEREAAIITTNAAGLARMTATAFNYFAARGGGQIAAVTSVAATRPIGPYAAYSSSKRCAATYLEAMRQLTHRQRLNIAITDLRPGWIDTPLLHPDEKYPMLMPPARAVKLMMHAIERRRKVAVIDGRWRLLAALWRLVPAPILRAIPYPQE